MEIEKLKRLLSKSWSLETCSPGLKEKWNKENPSLGQCAVTALIVNDFFDGKIMRCMTPLGSHYYNLIDDKVVDLTVEQFQGEIPNYEEGEERTKEYLLSNEDTYNRYKTLGCKLDDEELNEDIAEVARFYILATKLKYKIRSAWDNNHWIIDNDRLESIAEHVYGTCILAISMESNFGFGVDMEKVLTMLALHEIGEVLIGDITPFDNITEEEKANIEHKAMQEVLGDLYEKDKLYSLLLEFDEGKTKEARFAYLCDKLEFDLQFKVYQDKGYHHSLDDQKNNVVFKSSKIQEYIKNGAKEPFDICYEYDKEKFNDEEMFEKVLKYVKDNNTNI